MTKNERKKIQRILNSMRPKRSAKDRVIDLLLGIHDAISPSARAEKKRSREHMAAILKELHELPEE